MGNVNSKSLHSDKREENAIKIHKLHTQNNISDKYEKKYFSHQGDTE